MFCPSECLRAQHKTLKGKKVDVPGQKNKKKIGEDGTLLVGAIGIKIMDGPDVVASYLLQKLTSWEATGDVLRLGLDDKNWVEFITDDGSEICEGILTIAKQLVSQKKADDVNRRPSLSASNCRGYALSASPAAARVLSTSAAVCAAETNHASNCDGGG